MLLEEGSPVEVRPAIGTATSRYEDIGSVQRLAKRSLGGCGGSGANTHQWTGEATCSCGTALRPRDARAGERDGRGARRAGTIAVKWWVVRSAWC
jgi:hypothetical protein